MKDKVKGLALGIVIGTMITCATGYAATNTKLSVVLENVKFMFNGVHKQTSQAIIYNGQLYTPAKNIAQGLGESFSYDGKNKTAWIGAKQSTYKYLEELSYARIDGARVDNIQFKKWNDQDRKFTITDQQFLHGIGAMLNWDAWDSKADNKISVDYNLNGKYKRLTGQIGVDDETKNSDNSGVFVILGDGQELFRSGDIKGGDLPTKVDIDISGVLKLQLKFETLTNEGSLNMVFAEAKVG